MPLATVIGIYPAVDFAWTGRTVDQPRMERTGADAGCPRYGR
ncbi:hypothetical protein HDE71_000667 [Janthinobacterium sp. S3M3]|nr:hypothetical protein [Janthinobacterium sp. S3T4]MBB5611670.1 hypothetical protein [Janthinobacterium sp. S3M3]